MHGQADNNTRLLVRFANPSLAPGCVVTDAKLRLNAKAAAAGRTLEALRVTGDRSEGAVTRSNEPATSGTAATVSSGTGYREWNVTSQVRTSYQNGVDRGFLIRDAGENADAEQQFDSRDAGGNRPQHSGNQQSFHSTEKAPDSPPQLVVTFG